VSVRVSVRVRVKFRVKIGVMIGLGLGLGLRSGLRSGYQVKMRKHQFRKISEKIGEECDRSGECEDIRLRVKG
jgi:hypothetical protein